MPEYAMLLIQDTNVNTKLQCTVEVQTGAILRSVTLTVDTGASVSVLPKAIYEDYFGKVPLQPPAARLVTYSRTPIDVLGCMHATVKKDCNTCAVDFYIVEKGTALMGMDLITALQLSIKGDTILSEPVTTANAGSSESVLQLSTHAEMSSVGCVTGFMHKVKISDAVTPVRQKLRRLPFSVRTAVSVEIERLLSAGIIERIDASPWVSPIVVTMKKTGGIRMCMDLREPNKAVIIDYYALPHMEELLTALAGSTVFSTIDLESAYHQVPLHPESRDLTAFITHDGLFRFCRVPYGLASAPSVFQKMMECILKGIPNVQNYLDDVICFRRTESEHDAVLNTVLKRLHVAGL
ncbi:uncharacterized protein K02A2.6-like [Tachysurus vachellii]|uniref:uncharacterized protein K02A2.6-like n=1 Tax=Tachysurus vachellii TaxID=175792 RepID=UPI00296B5431|nr:uncharacterized protein K02A2.6-like [Tachysurus vachellii]